MRYHLLKDGHPIDDSGNMLLLVDRYWLSIKGIAADWVIVDMAPRHGQHCTRWRAEWDSSVNGVVLTPMGA